MKADTVSLVRAMEDPTTAVEEALALLGSPLDALSAGMRVLIKPNLFQLKPGFQANPAIICALARLASARGARVIVAERTRNIHKILADSPVHRYAEVVSLDDVPLRVVAIEGAESLRVPIAIPTIVMDCDYFIGVPQLRTHAGVLMTNALKNLIGLLPGYTTRVVHMAGVEESVVDLNVLRPQHLVVCDATTVIEGNYPLQGEARRIGLVAASQNALALDVVMASVAGFNVKEIEYFRHAHRRGLGPATLAEIEVRGLVPSVVAFDMHQAPRSPGILPDGIEIHSDSACVQCKRYIAGVMEALDLDLAAHRPSLCVVSGPRDSMPMRNGPTVLVGNCMYPHRDAGLYVEGCPPRAIQIAAFRHALGQPASADARSQFRLPSPSPSLPPSEVVS